MRYSQYFLKTLKEAPKNLATDSAKLLYRAGYIRESTAGRYYFLPLGIRVMDKIRKMIKKEIDQLGAHEIITPVLHPLALWQETNRDRSAGYELTTVKDRHGARFALGGTAEEMLIDLVRKFTVTYKDLPFSLYQFSTKFRDELRPQGGLLRVREFLMKDAYSFDRSAKEFGRTYQAYWQAYERIFTKLGLATRVVEADNGYIGGEYCHEFVVDSPVGESQYWHCDKCGYAAHAEVVKKGKDDQCAKCKKGKMTTKVGIEVGNIFQLGYHYSKKMKDAVFTDQDGQRKPYYMGCYGIGLGRTMAAVVEVNHDEKGIIWPDTIAPFQVYLISIGDQKIQDRAQKIHDDLEKQGIEVLWDDRPNVSAGQKFTDADLVGIPNRYVISLKTGGNLEFKQRSKSVSQIINKEDILKFIIHNS